MTRRRYHHGDLKRALMDSALRLIERVGPQGFTMSDLAREAEVSSGAPYRHFKDKADLLEALALEGVALAEEVVAQEQARAGEVSAMHAWRTLGVATVVFAATYPAYYRVMNAPEILDRQKVPRFAEAQARLDAIADQLLAAAHASGELVRTEPGFTLLAAQATMYGLSRMIVDGVMSPVTPDEARALAEGVAGVLGYGLVPREDSPAQTGG
ncbi:MAG: TetR/AcrR family transcriptional regulator [Alphaproteobacteria bacterium]|nr:TetR/AcrR family transcriptional regulator [Alphaproteobacteria bacterium]